MAVTRDLSTILSTLVAIANTEPIILHLIANKHLITDNTPPYRVPALGGDLSLSQAEFVNLAESFLDIAANMLVCYSGKTVNWRKMMFQPAQVVELFFTDRIFRYIEEEAALIIQSDEEKEEQQQKPHETPQNELEGWCFSFASLLRMGKTPRGAQELMSLTRGEITGIVKFWNIAEKKLYSGLEKDDSLKTDKEKAAELKKMEQKLMSPELAKRRESLERHRLKLFNLAPEQKDEQQG